MSHTQYELRYACHPEDFKSYDTSPEHIRWSVDNSLRQLGTDYIDLLLIHRPDPLMNAEEVAEAYGAWKEKNMYGRKYWGIERSAFIIGPDGTVTDVFRRISAKKHNEKVLGALAGS